MGCPKLTYRNETETPFCGVWKRGEGSKELKDHYDFGARMYDPQIAQFISVDPLADIAPSWTPYHYVRGNPINRVDPTGLTDFALNKKTGDVTQVGEANDDPDRIVKTDKDGNVKRKGEGFLGFLVSEKNRGEAKTAVGGIEKNILKDGQNFKTEDNIIEVGGEGQPTVQGVESFALKLASHVGKEIKGSYFANTDGTDVDNSTAITIGQYQFNGSHESVANGDFLGYSRGLSKTGTFHTHQSTGDRTIPSPADKSTRDSQLRKNPSLRFFILTFPLRYGDRDPNRIEYTKGFR